jgi:hypothetical protein
MFNSTLYNPDGSLKIEARGKNVGTNQQAYEFDISQPGQQYFDYTWSSIPNLRSNTAMTIFNGVGTNHLTVPDSVVQQLYQGIFNSTVVPPPYAGGAGNNSAVPVTNQILGATPTNVPFGCFVPGQTGALACAAGVTPVKTTILNNEKPLTLGIQHDRQEVEYKWTPDGAWTMKVDYSHDHRFGVQEQGFLFSTGTSTPMAQVPMPINDTTDNASISAEYFGLSPWGMKWNGMIKYDLSLYRDAFTQYSVENPFGGPGSPAPGVTQCPIATAAGTVPNCYGWGAMDTAPNNSANSVMAQTGIDLPGFKSNRFMSTLQFTDMRQNAAFTPETINAAGLTGAYSVKNNLTPPWGVGAGVALSPVPRGSLDGKIDTFLSNNVLSTQLTPELKNKINYRFYSYENDTPMLTLANWLVNDAAIATPTPSGNTGVGSGSYAPHTTLFSSYVKQNAAEELVWNPASWGTFGVSSGWEQYRYKQYAADATNEFTEKFYGRVTPFDWLAIRGTEAYSWRRYDNYNWQNYIGSVMLAGVSPAATGFVENPALVAYNIANRDRHAGNLYMDITTPINGLTVTPNAGYRLDDYPADNKLTSAGLTQLGLKNDHAFNYGAEINWTVTSTLQVMGSYTHDSDSMDMLGTASGSLPLSGRYNSNMREHGNTYMAGMNFLVIPDKLSLKMSGTMSSFKNDWTTGPYPGDCATGSTANCGLVSAGNPAYPTILTKFSRFDTTLSYKVDSTYASQMQVKDIVLKLHWAYERNAVQNWQADSSSPYLYSVLNSSTVAMKDMIFLAGNNPNYTAQLIALSAVVKW